MKQLNKAELHRVVRELDECPALKRWFWESRQELYERFIGATAEDFQHMQGQVITLNQILDKDTDLE